jgi:isopenicillin N synthase-like dioxygenase
MAMSTAAAAAPPPPPDTPIPIVDFGQWRRGTAPERRRIARELTDACQRVGFAYVVNHGVPAAELAAAFAWTRRLFALPDAHKMLAPHPPGPTVHRGYSWPGLEKVSQYVHRDDVDGDADEADRRLRSIMDYKAS